MVIHTLVKVDKKSIEKLKKACRVQTILEPTPLLYQGHIPIVAYLVVDGAIHLLKNKKIKSTILPGEVIGIRELLTDTPSSVTAKTTADTTICYLDRSTILGIIEEDSKLSEYFLEILKKK